LLYENVYDKQPNTIQPFGLRVNTHFENSDINLDDIAPIVIPENPSWSALKIELADGIRAE
jgi:hypothetical protein